MGTVNLDEHGKAFIDRAFKTGYGFGGPQVSREFGGITVKKPLDSTTIVNSRPESTIPAEIAPSTDTHILDAEIIEPLGIVDQLAASGIDLLYVLKDELLRRL